MGTMRYADTKAKRESTLLDLLLAFLCLFVPALGSADAQSQVNPEKLNNIRRLIELQGGKTELKHRTLNAFASAIANLGKKDADLAAALKTELEGAGLDEFIQSIESVYDKYLTDEEVGEMLRVYQSSSRSHINKMSRIAEEINRVSREWARRLAIRAMSKHIGIFDAAVAGNIALVSELLTQGVDVNSRDPKGVTPLVVAARKGNTEMARLLLEKGANPNSRTNTGGTPLMAAVFSENNELIELLLSKGSDPNAKDDRGINAYQLAEYMDKKGAAALLKKKTADTSPVSFSMVVGKLGDAKECVPVMNFPTASSKELKCLKAGQEVVPAAVQTTEGWELISHPVIGWVPSETLKPMFRVTRVGPNEGREISRGGEQTTQSRGSQRSRERPAERRQEEEPASQESIGGKWWKER
ncbi:MAG: ankyrin repeat domain-containing protein [Pseudomonadota bacterium]